MDTLDFSYNWNNKLDCQSFTTFRLHNPQRYAIGKTFDIYLKNKFVRQAQIIALKTLTLSQVNEFIARLDSGYDLEQFRLLVRTMYKKTPDLDKQPFDLLLLASVTQFSALSSKTNQVTAQDKVPEPEMTERDEGRLFAFDTG